MKTGLWVVIVLVTGIVGFLVGYSVSAYTGVRVIAPAQAAGKPAEPVAKPAGHAEAPAPTSGGYGGGAQQPAQPAAAAGQGGAKPAAAPAKPKAAGY